MADAASVETVDCVRRRRGRAASIYTMLKRDERWKMKTLHPPIKCPSQSCSVATAKRFEGEIFKNNHVVGDARKPEGRRAGKAGSRKASFPSQSRLSLET